MTNRHGCVKRLVPGPVGRFDAPPAICVAALCIGLAIASGPPVAVGHRNSSSAVLHDLRIHDVQGAAQRSPLAGREVAGVPGIVTAIGDSSFTMQDPVGDSDPATSEAVVVYTGHTPTLSGGGTLALGDAVQVSGKVVEHTPGGDKNNLPTTEISATAAGAIDRIAHPNTVFSSTTIHPVLLGVGGRAFPTETIEQDAHGRIGADKHRHFDPVHCGIDFYESLESMRVRVNHAQVVGPTNEYGEIYVVADRGRKATGLNARGGITVTDRNHHIDRNPERVEIDGTRLTGRASTPNVNVGAVFTQVTGTLGYAYGAFQIQPTTLDNPRPSPLIPEHASAVPAQKLSVATYNVENLDPNDNDGDADIADGKFTALGSQIVHRLRSPDILALQEIQDNDGTAVDHGIAAADKTLGRLVAAIAAAGGPHYAFTEISPLADTNGGEPGGNIRPAFLYRPARVTLVDVGKKGDAQTAVRVLQGPTGRLTLSANPGLVAPNAPAFQHSRKPLAALFSFHGQRVLLIDNHFTAKVGGSPLYGAIQPPIVGGQSQRIAQGDIVHRFIAKALAAVPSARVAALGDFNTGAFEPPLRHLTGAAEGRLVAADLLDKLPPVARYTYIYQGNAQAIDHIFATNALRQQLDSIQIVHINSEFANQVSDHDPVRAVFYWPSTH